LNAYLTFVLIVLVGDYLLDVILNILTIKRLNPKLPTEFIGYYDTERYALSQQYIRDQIRLSIRMGGIVLAILLTFILIGGFNWVDQLSRWSALGEIPSGLIFATILIVLNRILNLPFWYYQKFVLGERYHFNRMSRGNYLLDFVKRTLLKIPESVNIFPSQHPLSPCIY
jgi:STE24 endopeptidase